MNLYYAVGGGLGHLTRTTAFFYSYNLDYNDFIIIVSSPHAEIVFKNRNCLIVPAEVMNHVELLQQWLSEVINKYQVRNIYIDAFPIGLYGEWNHFPSSEKYRFFLISRILDWRKYAGRIVSPPVFDTIYTFETLDEHQRIFYQNLGCKIRFEVLKYPPAPIPEDFSEFLKAAKSPVWLIVHSETREEVLTLYNYARDVSYAEGITPMFVIISTCVIVPVYADTVSFNFFPAYPCFERGDKLFTACGFNSMQQAINIPDKHIFIPFERQFDNQFLRASMRKEI